MVGICSSLSGAGLDVGVQGSVFGINPEIHEKRALYPLDSARSQIAPQSPLRGLSSVRFGVCSPPWIPFRHCPEERGRFW